MSVVEYEKEIIVTNDGLGKRFDLPLLHNAIAVSQSNMTRVSIISLIDGGKRKAELKVSLYEMIRETMILNYILIL